MSPTLCHIVGIGASAGGLEALSTLLAALAPNTGKAFILVQHLDPVHESLLVDLLGSHTKMKVLQASDEMPIEPDHVYVIAPGTYLAAKKGILHATRPPAMHGLRLPIDFLFSSLADNYGAHATAVVLSGTGADGSVGIKALKAKGGRIIVQDPKQADYDGMPQSAIATGDADIVAPLAKIAEALGNTEAVSYAAQPEAECISDIIELLRKKTNHDFRQYKTGTLKRRIERRMALVAIKPKDTKAYLTVLRDRPAEIDLLAKDLLINVTSFFRDPKVFDLLASKTISDLIRDHPTDEPLRIWIAGCSTGEEAYSLAMLCREAIVILKSNIKLQIFASDVDTDAVATAREGLYPHTIAADVSEARLARFFAREDHGYRVLPELRSSVVFTVQDVLVDPPFSRLDMVSCRNLLIYLSPEAQAKVIALFHFAIRKGGFLLLGNAETVGNAEARFAIVSKSERLYRHMGRQHSGEIGFSVKMGGPQKNLVRVGQNQTLLRQSVLADLCQRLMMESHVPAAVLINRKQECLYTIGPTERYLRVARGHASHDVLAMAPPALRTKLRSAIQQVSAGNNPLIIAGGKAHNIPFNISTRSVISDGEELLFICFIDVPFKEAKRTTISSPPDVKRVTELEQELDATREELQGAIHSLELASEDQRAINEEALSVNEEFQSTNEELLTSKEELQSLNEELTALNSQLQETLERQRTTSNDLQNVLYSTDVATLFLDADLHIRFFTPATKSLFNVIPGDIGRPLADLQPLAADSALIDDARTVLHDSTPIDCEVKTSGSTWYMRRIMPYLTDKNAVEGVVITFTNITENKQVAKLLEDAKRRAEIATIAKSRFLAAASHDLRQPLQTLSLLQGLLGKSVQGEKAKKLVVRLDDTLASMSGMLNALLDINQIEAGTVRPKISCFMMNDLLEQLREEFRYLAEANKLALRVVRCSMVVETDRRMLEQMLRNLLANALKYTVHGKMVLGCRRRKGVLSIEVLDTGIGIADAELTAIFEEFHQVDNVARERSRGLGLGLSIVQRLGKVLGHPVRVRSTLGKGSVFSIEVPLQYSNGLFFPKQIDELAPKATRQGIAILIIEDDSDVRDLLDILLTGEGHHITTTCDAVAALKLIKEEKLKPDLILTDYNLPNGMNGLQLAAKLREILGALLPVIILTGDISSETICNVAGQNCVQINKPVKVAELIVEIEKLLPVANDENVMEPSP